LLGLACGAQRPRTACSKDVILIYNEAIFDKFQHARPGFESESIKEMLQTENP